MPTPSTWLYLDTVRETLATELAESFKDYCATLLGYYVFSGEDCTGSFKGKGKVGPSQKLEKNPMSHKAFGELGDSWDLNPELLTQVEKFTCFMYGLGREWSSGHCSCQNALKNGGGGQDTSTSKVDLVFRLPPCHSAIKPHIQHTNHRVALYKQCGKA